MNPVTKIAIIGLGKTGLSCIDYYQSRNAELVAIDEFAAADKQQVLLKKYPNVEFHFSPLDYRLLNSVNEVVVSPGVDLRQPVLQQLIANGKAVVGDVEIFSRQVKAPVIAVTGTNGKTTVVHWLEQLLLKAGFTVKLAGNVGTPVLSLCDEAVPDYYVLELSSFQLESTVSLQAKVAAVINVEQDHLDRYESLADYRNAKNRIYHNAELAVLNIDDNNILLDPDKSSVSFSILNNKADYHVINNRQGSFLAKNGHPFFSISQLKMLGNHVVQNALVVAAISDSLAIDRCFLLEVLGSFTGLRHRLELVAQYQEVSWFNDSKATNESAAVSAIMTVSTIISGKVVLIAGGDAKGSTFDKLSLVKNDFIRSVILLGKDKEFLAGYFSPDVNVRFVNSMQAAVQLAEEIAVAGDAVLLSPACSSLDMFSNYAERGEVFSSSVNALYESKGVESK